MPRQASGCRERRAQERSVADRREEVGQLYCVRIRIQAARNSVRLLRPVLFNQWPTVWVKVPDDAVMSGDTPASPCSTPITQLTFLEYSSFSSGTGSEMGTQAHHFTFSLGKYRGR